jgi:hypothetical protein
LQALQLVTVFEGLIPGTQLIPTMTAAWVLARIMKKRQPQTELRSALQRYQLESRSRRRSDALASEYQRRALPLPSESDDDSVLDGEYYEEDMDYLPLDQDEEEPW